MDCASIANALLGNMIANGLKLRVVISLLTIIISSLVSLVTILLSAWFPAKKASKISPIDSIKDLKTINNSKDFQIKKLKLQLL